MSRRCQLGIVNFVESYPLYIPMRVSLWILHIRKNFFWPQPLLYIWAKKGRLSHRLFRYQVIIIPSNILQISGTPGSFQSSLICSVAMFALKDLKAHHLAQEETPRVIKLLSQSGQYVLYLIDQNSSRDDKNGNFYRFVLAHLCETKEVHLKNDDTCTICTIIVSKLSNSFFSVFGWFWESINNSNGQ